MARNYRTCSFCGRDATEVEKLIHGPGNVSICNECVKTCPAKAVRLENNRIVIDQLQCLSYGGECNEACVAGCPRHIFRYTRGIMEEIRPVSGIITQTGNAAPQASAQE